MKLKTEMRESIYPPRLPVKKEISLSQKNLLRVTKTKEISKNPGKFQEAETDLKQEGNIWKDLNTIGKQITNMIILPKKTPFNRNFGESYDPVDLSISSSCQTGESLTSMNSLLSNWKSKDEIIVVNIGSFNNAEDRRKSFMVRPPTPRIPSNKKKIEMKEDYFYSDEEEEM